MILDRYLSREILKPQLAICMVLVFIFAGYSSARYMSDAANGLMSGMTVTMLIALKILIALEVLLPVTLYLSVIISLGRFYADSEVAAIEACGITPARLTWVVFKLSLIFAMVVAVLSLFVRPWAYDETYRLSAQAQEEFDLGRIEEGRFYEISNEGRVFFARQIDSGKERAHDVFIQDSKGDRRQVTYAREAVQRIDPASGEKVLLFSDGYHYELDLDRASDRVVHFQRSIMPLRSREYVPAAYKRKAAPTFDLARSNSPYDVAEFQWRLSTGFSTLLLGMIGVPLSRTAPRRGKYAKVSIAVIIFAVHYNLGAIAKTWVEKGVVPFFPGLWWVTILLALVLLLLHRPVTSIVRYLRAQALLRQLPHRLPREVETP